MLGPAAPNEGVVAGLLTLAKETLGDAVTYFKDSPLTVASKYVDKASVLSMAIKIPVYLFFYFLFSYVMVEALSAPVTPGSGGRLLQLDHIAEAVFEEDLQRL